MEHRYRNWMYMERNIGIKELIIRKKNSNE